MMVCFYSMPSQTAPGEYVCLEEKLKTIITMIDKWCFPSYLCRFLLLSGEKRITGSYNFEKLHMNTNAIRGAWNKLDPFTQVKGIIKGKSELLCKPLPLSSFWKKDHPKLAKTWTDHLWIHRKVCLCMCSWLLEGHGLCLSKEVYSALEINWQS